MAACISGDEQETSNVIGLKQQSRTPIELLCIHHLEGPLVEAWPVCSPIILSALRALPEPQASVKPLMSYTQERPESDSWAVGQWPRPFWVPIKLPAQRLTAGGIAPRATTPLTSHGEAVEDDGCLSGWFGACLGVCGFGPEWFKRRFG